MNLFIARFSRILGVVTTCDGCDCDVTLSGRRYRCLNCPDIDLCSNCYMCEYKCSEMKHIAFLVGLLLPVGVEDSHVKGAGISSEDLK